MTLIERLIIPAFTRRVMTNAEIYRAIRLRARRAHLRLSPHWRATVRNTLQRHAKGHPKRNHRPALFIHVKRATWKLRQ